MVLKKNQTGYKFDKLVKSFYKDVKEYLDKERTNHVMKPFGCDMAFVDAEMNYLIMDQLFSVWHELGFSEDIEIKYSTPTEYLAAMKSVNKEWTEAKGSNVTKEMEGWPIRKEDSFPYSQTNDIFINGFYSTRP
jgi:lysosomal alpha-mannosidase